MPRVAHRMTGSSGGALLATPANSPKPANYLLSRLRVLRATRANLLIRSKNSLIRSDSENTDMNATPLSFQGIKVIAWSVSDLNRASRFYGETLGLPPVCEGTDQVGYLLGHTILMLKADWYAGPTELPNPRVIISTDHAPSTEAALQARGVTIPDRVQVNDECYVGSFLDSEGNKLWFCSPV